MGGPVAVVAVAALAMLVTTAGRSAAGPPPDAQSHRRDAPGIFVADCAFCHGTRGEGTSRAPSLAGVGGASVYFQLASGRMPLAATGGRAVRARPAYPASTIEAMVAYVARLTGGGGPAVPRLDQHGDVAAGGELYRLDCAACHAWSGEGGALFEREAPSIHGASPTEVAAIVRAGSGNMPAFGTAALSDRQLAAVVAYVHELDHPEDVGGNPLWHLGPFAEGLIALGILLPVVLMATRWIGERA
jgi:ubiquinol-cytochrome c reductase cytochrome c subunit